MSRCFNNRVVDSPAPGQPDMYPANEGAVARGKGAVSLVESSCHLSFVSETRGTSLVKPTRKNIVVDLDLDTDTDMMDFDIVSCRVKSRPTKDTPGLSLLTPTPTPSPTPTPPQLCPPPRPPPIPHPGGLQQIAIALRTAGHKPRNRTQHSSVSAAQSSGLRRDEPWSRRSERRAVNIYWGLLPPPFHRP